MGFGRWLLIFFCISVYLLFASSSVQGRHHRRTKHKHHSAPSLAPPPPCPPPPPPESSYYISDTVFDVRTFDAVGDGITDDTAAFKMAWDTVCQTEGSGPITLLVPQSLSFMIQSVIFTGPCKSNVVFQVNGTLTPPDGPDSWPRGASKKNWLIFYRVDGMSLQGSGVIDGRGDKWWNLPCKPHKGINGTTLPGPCDSPVAIRFFMSTNLIVQQLKIQNSPQFNFRFDTCKGVHIESITIEAPGLSPNTDGIHLENTQNVGIYDSIVSNGDDCVSIGSGSYNVEIRNVTCGPSHGISIGSLGSRNSKACVSNITVTDSFIKNSDNGVRIKTWQGGSGSVSGVIFDNVHMDNVRNPILIDQFYCQLKECLNQTSAVFVSDILYSNIRGTYDVRSPAIQFACSDSIPCTNLTLSEVELVPSDGDIVLEPLCRSAYGISKTITIPPVFCLQDGQPRPIIENDIDRC